MTEPPRPRLAPPSRTIARAGIELSAVGLGCWAIGGPYVNDKGLPCGYGKVEDEQSCRAVQRALDLGINLFDTAPIYGCGHSERILGHALASRRDEAFIATKFSAPIDETNRIHLPGRRPVDDVPRACEESLRRLNTDRIDLYQLHDGNCDLAEAEAIAGHFEKLVEAGKIRYFGWSTDDPDRARAFAAHRHCIAIQHRLNLLEGSREMLTVCEHHGLSSINRTPLGKGLLTGKFNRTTRFESDDVRQPWWDLVDGREAQQLQRLNAVRELLVADGRSLAQAALGYLWGLSDCTIPIPGFKSTAQVEEHAQAMAYGPLSVEIMQRITGLLDRK